jgi:hypothetical protein
VISGLTSHDGEVTAFQLVELIERMITVDRKLTPAQLAELRQRRQQLLPADFPGPGAG